MNNKLMAENRILRQALEIYADKYNWTETARQEVLTGEVRADGWEESVEAELVMHDRVIWKYDGDAGHKVAQAALLAIGSLHLLPQTDPDEADYDQTIADFQQGARLP